MVNKKKNTNKKEWDKLRSEAFPKMIKVISEEENIPEGTWLKQKDIFVEGKSLPSGSNMRSFSIAFFSQPALILRNGSKVFMFNSLPQFILFQHSFDGDYKYISVKRVGGIKMDLADVSTVDYCYAIAKKLSFPRMDSFDVLRKSYHRGDFFVHFSERINTNTYLKYKFEYLIK